VTARRDQYARPSCRSSPRITFALLCSPFFWRR
jgi:hypothetical protein